MSRLTLAMLSATATCALAAPSLAASGEEIVATVCAACHVQAADGTYSRIDAARRTPEGWEMNVVRMVRNYGLNLSDEDFSAVVRYLADTRGLSVAETDGFRYILEQDPVAFDTGPDELMTQTCGRCHSYARVALQRRTGEDWQKLINFHLGQFPSLEYQALARDRDWWGIANDTVLTQLTERYVHGEAPAASDADLTGVWRVAGRQPGRGDYAGTLTVTGTPDAYEVTQTLTFADGSTETQTGTAVLYGAGEWRASMTSGETELREVMALRPDGSMEGRWFHRDQSTLGGRILAVREDAASRILSVSPDHIKAGETAEIRIAGVGLDGAPVLADGLSAETVSASPTEVVLRVTASADPTAARTPVSIGTATLPDALAVYASLDRVAVEPPLTFSRIGGNGGPIPKQPAVFDAIGWLNGADGKPGTDDDIRVGALTAEWTVSNFNAEAERMEDAKFAGTIGATGIFDPALAGPNPDRPMQTNNAGNLTVTATVTDGDKKLDGTAHLYATVQRFVDPPIR